jgi:hypothetical protein
MEKLKFHASHVYTQNGPSIHNFQNFYNFLEIFSQFQNTIKIIENYVSHKKS